MRLLIAENSKIASDYMTNFFSMSRCVELIGVARDAWEARDLLVRNHPDIFVLNMRLPKMSGMDLLKKIMLHLPVRTIMVSSDKESFGVQSMEALKYGAMDVLLFPEMLTKKNMEIFLNTLEQRLKVVINSPVPLPLDPNQMKDESKKLSVGVPEIDWDDRMVIAIGSSTGGTEAVKQLLRSFPSKIPPMLMVQHMPPHYTKYWSDSMNREFSFEVREAKDGDVVKENLVLVAPGDYHMELKREGFQVKVMLHQKPLIHSVRPAADYLFNSVAKIYARNAIGVVLTGMGKDGSQGLLAMRRQGSFNIAQDEATCVVFGMPKEAIDVGAIHRVLPLNKIAAQVLAKASEFFKPKVKVSNFK